MSPPTLVAPKATCAMIHVSRSAKCLRELNETKDDEDGLVFRKRKVAPSLDETTAPQVKKVKPTPQVPPPPTQSRTSKREKLGAQRSKRPKGEQSTSVVAAANDAPPVEIPPICK